MRALSVVAAVARPAELEDDAVDEAAARREEPLLVLLAPLALAAACGRIWWGCSGCCSCVAVVAGDAGGSDIFAFGEMERSDLMHN